MSFGNAADLRAVPARYLVAVAAVAAALASCNPAPAASPSSTSTPTPFLPTPSSTLTRSPTATASPTATPTRAPVAERIPIIEYHYSTYKTGDDVMMTTEWFRSQLSWLADNGYGTLTAEQLASFLDGGEVPAKSVVLTFDIGTAHRSDYLANIIPELKKHGFHALFFVVINALSDECGSEDKTCWSELRDWAAQGLISVESHGVYHPDYATITTEEQRWDLTASRQTITEKTGRAPVGFAYPHDSYTEGATRVVKSAGYSFALAGNTRIDRSVHRSDPDRFFLPRIYPYSNLRIYPAILGANGKTFAQLIEENSAAASPAAVKQTSTATPTRSAGADEYFYSCASVDRIQDSTQRLYSLNRLAFATDVGPETQIKLAHPILLSPSCNTARGNNPRGIVLHATRGTLKATLSQFQRPQSTSAHYVINRDGQIYQLVPEGLGAFHASCGGNRTVCLPSCPLCESPDGAFLEPYLQSIGIELVNDGQLTHPETYTGLIYEDYLHSFGYQYWEDFPETQLQALKTLVNDIRARRGIPLDLVVGHYRINEKTDPGPALNISWYRVGNPAREPIFLE